MLWQNDPDILYLCDYNTNITEREQKSIALWSGFMGGTITTSCRFHKLDPGSMKLWRFLKPGERHDTSELPLWGENEVVKVAVREYPEPLGKAVLFVNPADSSVERTYPLNVLTEWQRAFVYYWEPFAAESAGEKSELKIRLSPHESVLFYLAQEETPPPAAMTISGILQKKQEN